MLNRYNRREFLSSCAVAIGSYSIGSNASADPSLEVGENRRHVWVGGKRAEVIDIHAHCVFPGVSKFLNDSPFADVPMNPKQSLGPGRIDEIDDRGIDIQVLSVNRYWWYQASEELAARIVHFHDESLSAWCQKHPDRFVALSSVALQYPELAAMQLEYAVESLGHRGASIGGDVLGESLSSARFDPFWDMAQALDVPVFMHPTGGANIVREGALDGSGELPNIVGNPLETTVFLSHMIFDGVLDRFPRLQICAAHGGGYLPSYLGRSDIACEVRPNAKCKNRKKPSTYFRDQIFLDSMVFSDEGLRHLVAEVGASQVVYGSDIPFNWPDTIDVIVGADFLQNTQKRAILSQNVRKLLSLPQY